MTSQIVHREFPLTSVYRRAATGKRVVFRQKTYEGYVLDE